MKIVKVQVGPDGKVVMDFDGYAGEECVKDASRLIAELEKFGVQSETRRLVAKPEMHRVSRHVRVGLG